jgi:hypothetical protein
VRFILGIRVPASSYHFAHPGATRYEIHACYITHFLYLSLFMVWERTLSEIQMAIPVRFEHYTDTVIVRGFDCYSALFHRDDA